MQEGFRHVDKHVARPVYLIVTAFPGVVTRADNQRIDADISLCSDAQAKLMQPGSSDINLERVEALKLAIRNGELKMDTGKIADALINEAQQDLQSN